MRKSIVLFAALFALLPLASFAQRVNQKIENLEVRNITPIEGESLVTVSNAQLYGNAAGVSNVPLSALPGAVFTNGEAITEAMLPALVFTNGEVVTEAMLPALVFTNGEVVTEAMLPALVLTNGEALAGADITGNIPLAAASNLVRAVLQTGVCTNDGPISFSPAFALTPSVSVVWVGLPIETNVYGMIGQLYLSAVSASGFTVKSTVPSTNNIYYIATDR